MSTMRAGFSVALGLATLAFAAQAFAAETLNVPTIPAITLDKIVLTPGGTASIVVNETSGAVTVASGGALLLPAAKTIFLPTITVTCAIASGNGCKATSHTVTVSVSAPASTAGW